MIDLSQYDNSGFCRGASRFREAAWWVVRGLLFMHAFPVPSSLKVGALRWFGARVGRGVVIRSRVNVTFPWRLSVGDHVWLGDEVLILSLAEVTIGSNVCLSQRAFLCTGSHDFSRPTFDLVTAPICIEDGCWVAAGAFVGPGVTLGASSLCAAASVVVKDVPAGAVVGGNPARPLRGGSWLIVDR